MALALLVVLFGLAYAKINDASPEFLDQLLAEKRYDEFSFYMDIENPEHVRPNEETKENPMFHKDLLEGDIMLKPWQKEQQRQGIRFEKYTGSRWPNARGQPSYMPVTISSQFSSQDRNTIMTAIRDFNSKVSCVQIKMRQNESDYINVFPGNGCWSYLGRTGNEQGLSLGDGCVYNGVILHEFDHAVGFSHEHNRNDRNNFVDILWENIPEKWRSQYEENDRDTFGLQSNYDYYSIMHYPMQAPETGRDAFRIKQNGIDRNRIGNGQTFTQTDLDKIKILYGC